MISGERVRELVIGRLREPMVGSTQSVPGRAILHECRLCGRTFDEHPSVCPACKIAEIASYEFTERDKHHDDETL